MLSPDIMNDPLGTHALTRAMRSGPVERGVVVQDTGQTYLAKPDADSDEVRTLAPLQAEMCVDRQHRFSDGNQPTCTQCVLMMIESSEETMLCTQQMPWRFRGAREFCSGSCDARSRR